MKLADIKRNLEDLAAGFETEHAARRQRQSLDPGDFEALRDAGYPLLAAPPSRGGFFESVEQSVRLVCDALRGLARADSSLALVSAMHPAVLSYWLTSTDADGNNKFWDTQCNDVFTSVEEGAWWGTLTSEPGSGGDIMRTQAKATPTDTPLGYTLKGAKHFGSGSGIMHVMVTTAVARGESKPDWFFLNVKDVGWDGDQGIRLIAEWDGHGMTATQSHAFDLQDFPATRIAWPGHLSTIASRTGPFIGCLFTGVVLGILDAALSAARERVGDVASRKPYEQVEWARVETDYWMTTQAFEGMLRAVENDPLDIRSVLCGKTGIAELSESILTRLCRLLGGGTFSRRSPFGYWFEDVRALGFLRPPWALAYDRLIDETNPKRTSHV